MKFLLENERIYPYACGGSLVSGGAERQQWLLSRALVDRGHEVVVYTRTTQARPSETIKGVRFCWQTPQSIVLAWWKMLRAERPDWVYRRCSDFNLGVLAPLAKIAGVKVVFASAHQNDCNPPIALTRRRYLWPLYALGLRIVDRILVQHESQIRLLPLSLRSKSFSVSGISPVVEPDPERENQVVWVSVIRKIKRPHLLVDIANSLPNVKFVACGAPALSYAKSSYAGQALDLLNSCPNIDYRGKISPEAAEALMRSSKLLLSTSSAEGFPNTFLQAWGGGVPVVSCELDPAGAIRSHNAGLVGKDVSETVQAIRRLLDDEQLNRTLGENGRNYVRKVHGEDKVIREFLASLGPLEEYAESIGKGSAL